MDKIREGRTILYWNYFWRRNPVELNGERKNLLQIIENLNEIVGSYGIGRIDHIENRLVGIKSREIYEAPSGGGNNKGSWSFRRYGITKRTCTF